MMLPTLLVALMAAPVSAVPADPVSATAESCPQDASGTAATCVGAAQGKSKLQKQVKPGRPGKLGGVSARNLARVDARSATAIQGLQERMHAAAGDGAGGITPAMADDVRATLLQAQGGISPEMSALLDATRRDGGKLTPETMTLLQGAGKEAKAAGLDLGIAPGVESDLLGHDFSKDKPQ